MYERKNLNINAYKYKTYYWTTNRYKTGIDMNFEIGAELNMLVGDDANISS